MKQYSVILIGAGLRGKAYTDIMYDFKDKFKVIGVADPIDARRMYIKEKHNISDDMCFETYEEILSKPIMADLAVIATMDNAHYEPAMKAIELGYDLTYTEEPETHNWGYWDKQINLALMWMFNKKWDK